MTKCFVTTNGGTVCGRRASHTIFEYSRFSMCGTHKNSLVESPTIRRLFSALTGTLSKDVSGVVMDFLIDTGWWKRKIHMPPDVFSIYVKPSGNGRNVERTLRSVILESREFEPSERTGVKLVTRFPLVTMFWMIRLLGRKECAWFLDRRLSIYLKKSQKIMLENKDVLRCWAWVGKDFFPKTAALLERREYCKKEIRKALRGELRIL